MDSTVKMLKQKLADFRTEKPFSLLYLLFQKVNDISGEETGQRREERLHSEMLAALLNPETNDGVGSVLIETLLDELEIKGGPRNKFSVELERYVDGENGNKRPIDILVSWEEAGGSQHAIIIENKIARAGDQFNQLNDYHDGLERAKIAVDKIIYIPLKGERKPSYLKKNVRKKTVVMDAKRITTQWLEKSIARAKDEKKNAQTIAAIEHYKEFLECFIINKAKLMKSHDILSEMTSTQVRSLEALLASAEWIEGKFKSITENLKKRLGPELKVEYQRYKSLDDDGGPRHNARFYFNPNDYWIEIWMDDGNLVFYVCSHVKKKWVTIGDTKYKYQETDNGNNGNGIAQKYYYYYNDEGHWFEYPAGKASDVNEKLIQTMTVILESLSPKKGANQKARPSTTK